MPPTRPTRPSRRWTSRLPRRLGALSATLLVAVATLRTRLDDRDDTGLSSPEKAALTVLGLALAGIVAYAATNYVTTQTEKFK